jgi:hypothetical protein
LVDSEKDNGLDLSPLQTKMGDPILDITKVGVLAQKGKLGRSGNPSRSEAEDKVGKAWEKLLELRKQAAEKVNAYAEYADTVLQNGKLAKDILAASTAIALSIPTGGQSLWFMMAAGAVIGGCIKGGFYDP